MRAGFLLAALLLVIPVPGKAQTPTTGETVIRGVVFDSLRMRPLGSANVQIAAAAGAPWIQDLRDGFQGGVRARGVPNGTYLIGFFHAELDSLGLLPPTFRLDVRAGPPIHMLLAIPSARTIARALCGRNDTSDSTGLFWVTFAAPTTRAAAQRKTGHPMGRNRHPQEVDRSRGSDDRSLSGPNGMAAVCGLPLATSLPDSGRQRGRQQRGVRDHTAFDGVLPSRYLRCPAHADVGLDIDSAPTVALLRGHGPRSRAA